MAIQTTQVTQYTTSDGKVFLSETEALSHEAGLANAAVIDAYLTEKVEQERTRVTAKRHIEAFLAFQEEYKQRETGEAEEEASEEGEGLNMSLEND